jgi:hypothetical protein
MDKQSQRIPTRLWLDFMVLAASIIIIAFGVWIGFQDASLPLLLATPPQ